MKKNVGIRLEEETLKKLNEFCKQTKQKKVNVVETAINLFIENGGDVKDALTIKLEEISKRTAENIIKEKVAPDLARIRAAANNADYYSQVTIELLNHQFRNLDKDALVTTDIKTAPSLNKAFLVVKNRIHNLRIKKLDRQKKE